MCDCQNNIVLKLPNGNIVWDQQTRFLDNREIGVEFIWEVIYGMTQFVKAHKKKNIKDLHIELCHSSEEITHATTKSMGIKATSTFKACEDCALGKAKKAE